MQVYLFYLNAVQDVFLGVPFCGSEVINLTSIHKDVGSILGFAHWVKDPALCCHELWCRLAATAPIQPLAWELLYAAGVAQVTVLQPLVRPL